MAKRARRGPTMIQASRRVSPVVKAMFHHVIGAGKAKVKRPFMGLTDDDVRAIETLVGQQFEARLGRAR